MRDAALAWSGDGSAGAGERHHQPVGSDLSIAVRLPGVHRRGWGGVFDEGGMAVPLRGF